MKANIKFGIISIFLTFGIISFSNIEESKTKTYKAHTDINIETFTFTSNGREIKAKIYLPASYKSVKDLPVIYLIDFAEQHFKLATDEFEKVIEGVNQIQGFDALVVSLKNIPDYNAVPETFEEHYDIYKNMTSYVDSKFTKNPSRTLIGRGSESGIVLMALFKENQENSIFTNFIATDPSPKFTAALMTLIEENVDPKMETNKKLHFSFSKTNDQVQCNKLINLIEEANYSWLEFVSFAYTDSDYENTYPISYASGIEYVFSK